MSTQTQTDNVCTERSKQSLAEALLRSSGVDKSPSATNLDFNRKPLIKHFYEKDRTVTVAFTKDRQNNLVAYGAAVFRRCNISETWNRSAHVRTAMARLKKYPIIVQNLPQYKTKEDYNNNFFKNLRKCVILFGVRNRQTSPRVDWLFVPELSDYFSDTEM